MPKAKLIITEKKQNPREIEISGGLITIGRATDNVVSLTTDSNVSRYHAQIEVRGENFYLSDLGSSNGTTLNDEPIQFEKKLQANDQIGFGGESFVDFKILNSNVQNSSEQDQTPPKLAAQNGALLQNKETENEGRKPASETTDSATKFPVMLTVAAVLVGFAIVSVVIVGAVIWAGTSGSGCQGEAVIIDPESGATITEPTEVKINLKNPKCVDRAVYFVDGEEIGTADLAPYSIVLEPENLQNLIDDNSHVLTVALIDRNGEQHLQKDEILLAFEEPSKSKNAKSEKKSDPDNNQTINNSSGQNNTNVSLTDIKTMSERLVKQLGGNLNYRFNQQFLAQVSVKVNEYKAAGFSKRAAAYRDQINIAFIGEQGLEAPLGYVLAMSRSKFDLKKSVVNQNEEGLWRLTTDFAVSNGYNGQCGQETLSDPAQNCAARVAAVYTKALVVHLFQGDVVYGVACFGLSPAEAGQFQLTLPADRSDFWNAIKQPQLRQNLVNFFAAGIVADNPQKFGLNADQPISNLYPK